MIISGNFHVGAKIPIDGRFVVNTYADLAEMDNAYEGLRTYVKEEGRFYICKTDEDGFVFEVERSGGQATATFATEDELKEIIMSGEYSLGDVLRYEGKNAIVAYSTPADKYTVENGDLIVITKEFDLEELGLEQWKIGQFLSKCCGIINMGNTEVSIKFIDDVKSEDDIANYIENVLGNNGDIMIFKLPIAGNAYSYTSYVHNGTAWQAMDGNYNADNVYFDEDITYTANIGALTLKSGESSAVYSAKGKSVTAVLKAIMAETKAPTITQPSYTMSVSRKTDTNNLELGSKITALTWSGTFTDGTYSYGYEGNAGAKANAGCTAAYEVTCDKDGTASGQSASGTWTLANAIVVDSESAKTYGTITNKCTYTSSSRKPVNNLGDVVDGQIVGKTITQTKGLSLTGYREGYFYGAVTSALGKDDITSAVIRKLGKSGAKYAKGTKSFPIPVGAATVIFACPKTATGVTDVLNTTVNANMNEAFGVGSPVVVSVEGANGYSAVDYNVWFYTPAEAYGSTATLTITLG